MPCYTRVVLHSITHLTTCRYFRWWANTRDLNNDSLVTILHGWESGLDASPMYASDWCVNSASSNTMPHHPTTHCHRRHGFCRYDLAYNITAAKPSYWSLYPKFDELVHNDNSSTRC